MGKAIFKTEFTSKKPFGAGAVCGTVAFVMVGSESETEVLLSFTVRTQGETMAKAERNQREFLKCLHEIDRTLGTLSHFIEEGNKIKKEDRDDMIERINSEMSSLRKRLDRLDIRIGTM